MRLVRVRAGGGGTRLAGDWQLVVVEMLVQDVVVVDDVVIILLIVEVVVALLAAVADAELAAADVRQIIPVVVLAVEATVSGELGVRMGVRVIV